MTEATKLEVKETTNAVASEMRDLKSDVSELKQQNVMVLKILEEMRTEKKPDAQPERRLNPAQYLTKSGGSTPVPLDNSTKPGNSKHNKPLWKPPSKNVSK